jgi:hypothetical protein
MHGVHRQDHMDLKLGPLNLQTTHGACIWSVLHIWRNLTPRSDKLAKALFRLSKTTTKKIIQYPSHRIFGCMHGALNIGT